MEIRISSDSNSTSECSLTRVNRLQTVMKTWYRVQYTMTHDLSNPDQMMSFIIRSTRIQGMLTCLPSRIHLRKRDNGTWLWQRAKIYSNSSSSRWTRGRANVSLIEKVVAQAKTCRGSNYRRHINCSISHWGKTQIHFSRAMESNNLKNKWFLRPYRWYQNIQQECRLLLIRTEW